MGITFPICPQVCTWSTAASRQTRSGRVLALATNNHTCMQLKTSSSFFLSLCFFIVSVEKVELKGLAHKKNERNVEYSFEVSSGDFLFCFFFLPLKEGRITLKKELKKFSDIVRSQKLVLKDRCLVIFFFNQWFVSSHKLLLINICKCCRDWLVSGTQAKK